MDQDWKRRDFLTLMGLGGLVFASGLGACSRAGTEAQSPAGGMATGAAKQDFFFLQLSDTHWGYKGQSNPEADTCLKQTVAAINAVETQPDFIVFTGDLTHTTDDVKERRARMAQFREITSGLRAKKLIFLPGEHDAAPDRGDVYREAFGDLRQSFNHKGVYFIALDNASAPGGAMGDAQLDWLAAEVGHVPAGAPLVVLAHRPLFDLYPDWEWATKDGARAIEVLSHRDNVTVFYGHIHQENHHVTGSIAHHSARSLVFPLPGPGAAPKRVPLPWDPASSDHGLGHRSIAFAGARPAITEVPFVDRTASLAAASSQ
jgi:3',5'-cyclic AMP phosphodiesterase CpdA